MKLPGQLLKVLLQPIYGTAGKHPGISERLQESRQKYYFPSNAFYVKNWVRDYEICIQNQHIKITRVTPELVHMPEWDLGHPMRKLTYCQNYRQVQVTRIPLQQMISFRDMHLRIQFPTPCQ